MNDDIVSCIDIENIGSLVQLDNGKFQKIKDSELGVLLAGYNYVLVEHSLAEFIRSLSVDGIKFKSAKIWERESNSNNDNYLLMEIGHIFESDKINDLPIKGEAFFLMDKKYIFVTPSLRKKLSKSKFNLSFSLGLSEFG